MSGSRGKIVGQFIPRLVRMLESPAYRALSLSGHRVLARVEVEHGAHGGMDNGTLPVTFLDFENYGIDRHAIGPAIREPTPSEVTNPHWVSKSSEVAA